MATRDDVAIVAAGGATIASAIALIQANAKNSPGSGKLVLDDATTKLLTGMALSTTEIEDLLVQALNILQNKTPGSSGPTTSIPNAVPNLKTVYSTRISNPSAWPNNPARCPTILISDGYKLKVKADPGNAAIVYVAASAPSAINVNSAEPLVPGEFTLYQIKDAKELWFSPIAANDAIILTVEQ